jgi:hypothetical protein
MEHPANIVALNANPLWNISALWNIQQTFVALNANLLWNIPANVCCFKRESFMDIPGFLMEHSPKHC